MILGLALVALSGTFLLSGVAKVRDPLPAAQSMRELGIAPASSGAAKLLGGLELGVGVALLLPPTTVLARLTAVALLVVFTIAILIALVSGRRPACHCFGQLSSHPIGATTVVRNLVLSANARLTLATAYGVIPKWVQQINSPITMDVMTTMGAAALLLIGALFWQIIQQQGRMLNRIENLENRLMQADNLGLPTGEDAPLFTLPDLNGIGRDLRSFPEPGRSLLLVFSDPLCPSCANIAKIVAEWARSDRARNAVLLSRGTADANRAIADESGLTVLLQTDFEVGEAYGAPGTPSAVMIHHNGTVASPLVAGYPAITRFLAGL